MEGRPQRRLVVTVRGAADTSAATKPYVILQLGGQSVQTEVAQTAGVNPVWDEPIELRLPPPLPKEQPLHLRVKLMQHIPLFPDRMIGSGSQPLTDLFYGGGQHEITVPLTDSKAKPAGRLHLGILLEMEARPGEDVGSAAGTVLGQVLGGGPSSSLAATGAAPIQMPSDSGPEMQAREVLGAGVMQDPSKPGFGLYA